MYSQLLFFSLLSSVSSFKQQRVKGRDGGYITYW